jgi:hypothetical protein
MIVVLVIYFLHLHSKQPVRISLISNQNREYFMMKELQVHSKLPHKTKIL